jgi:hypothetical protein
MSLVKLDNASAQRGKEESQRFRQAQCRPEVATDKGLRDGRLTAVFASFAPWR